MTHTEAVQRSASLIQHVAASYAKMATEARDRGDLLGVKLYQQMSAAQYAIARALMGGGRMTRPHHHTIVNGVLVQTPAEYASPITATRAGIARRIQRALLLACLMLVMAAILAACTDAQAEAEATAADVQDARAAAMQAHIDAKCGHLHGRAAWRCALHEVERLQPARWTPEESARADAATQLLTQE